MLKNLSVTLMCLFFLTSCFQWSKVVSLWEGKFLTVDTKISKNRWKLSKKEQKLADTFYELDIELDDIYKNIQSLTYSNFEQYSKFLKGTKAWIKGVYLEEEKNGKIVKKIEKGPPLEISLDKIKKAFNSNSYSISYLIFNKNTLFLVKQEPEGEDNIYYIGVVVDIKKLITSKCNLFLPFGVVFKEGIVVSNGLDLNIISGIEWDKLIKKQIKGTLTIKNKGDIYWMARYLGERPIFYIIKL